MPTKPTRRASSTRKKPGPRKLAPASPKTFGERYRAAREAAGLSQQDVADVMGIDKRSVARYEQGGAVPSIVAAAKLARPIGASLDQLAGLSDASSTDPDLIRLFAQLNALPNEVRSAARLMLQALISTHTR